MFRDFQSQYLTQSATRIGSKYKKAVYTMYKNASFTEKLEPKQRKSELGILGPVIRAQIRDVIKVSLKFILKIVLNSLTTSKCLRHKKEKFKVCLCISSIKKLR